MPIYKCKIGSSDGKILEKEIEAVNTAVLKQSLEEQGFFVFELKKKPLQFLQEIGINRRKVDKKALLTFNQELLVLIKAGLPIIQALDTILERVERGRLPEILSEVREDVKGGAALSTAFQKHPKVFPHLYIASVQAGERTGDLPQTITRYIAFLKRSEGFRQKVISALVYPAIIIAVAFIAITLLLVYVVPTFSQVYADSQAGLPLPTQMLITFTGILKKYFIAVVGLVILAGFFFRRWTETTKGRYKVDYLKTRIPFIGQLLIKYSMTNFMRTLATVLGSGIPIIESLRMSVGTLNNVVLERKLMDAVIKVEEGVQLSDALDGIKIIPPLALRMLGVGETTGSLEEMLGDISEYFEDEIERNLQVLTTSIEPAIMIVMGTIIGAIVITMYLPIFKIAGTVG